MLKIFRIISNPFRLLSFLFLYIGYFWGYFADLFDSIFNFTLKRINIIEEKTENIVKTIPINEKVGKIIILIILILLYFIWSDYLSRINL